LTVPKVEYAVRQTLLQRSQSQDMRSRQIGHVNIITNAGSIGRVVIGSKDRNVFAVFGSSIQDEGHQVRFRIMVLANLGIWISSGSIEIS
jgi:hypothetical protein